MSEQIREQVSAFLDGELPSTETELLLKRLTRDPELRESFGRYALIGEAMRGEHGSILPRGFTARVNAAIDGSEVPVNAPPSIERSTRWWRPLAGAAMVASVAAVAVVALQHRTVRTAAGPLTADTQSTALPPASPVRFAPGAIGQVSLQVAATKAMPVILGREPISYTTPFAGENVAVGTLPASYVLAHSKYSSGLGQRGVLADLLIEDDVPAARVAPAALLAPVP